MKKILLLLLPFLCIWLGASFAQDVSAQDKPIGAFEPLRKEDRLLILAPHPDDEAIGCAGIIQQARSIGAKTKIAYLTNGEHNQLAFIVYKKRIVIKKRGFVHMGEVRRKEAIAAMKLLGLDASNLIFLGYPDFGTFNMFCRYWQSKKPFKDMLTRISSVPYKENLSYGSPYVAENMLSDLKKVVLDYKPTKIFVSHPADTNGDHRTFYLLLQIVLADLRKEIAVPKVYTYLIHRAGWPLPRHYHPELTLGPPQHFLGGGIGWKSFALAKEQLDKKHEAILCYKSQTASSAFYLLSFARKNELFCDYPDVKLKPQTSLAEQAVQFFGFSGMYSDPEEARFAGLENQIEDKGVVSFAVMDNNLFLRVEKSSELNHRFGLQLYLFNYNYKIPFVSMPKIRLILRHNIFKVFDERKLIKPEGVSLMLTPHVLILRIPLRVLGDPDFILASVRSYQKELPADTTGFMKIEVSK